MFIFYFFSKIIHIIAFISKSISNSVNIDYGYGHTHTYIHTYIYIFICCGLVKGQK